MGIQSTHSAAASQPQSCLPCPAKCLEPLQRQALAVQALAGTQPITQLAAEHQVSRKFVSQQIHKASQALDEAFAPAAAADDEVLGRVTVTKRWRRRLVLALLWIGHCSYRGVVELLRDVFQLPLSVERVHAIAHEAMAQARALPPPPLDRVRIGAHDEIFQNRQPVLVGVDVASTYGYLLSLEAQRDGATWGVRLLDLQEQGFAPDAIISDGGSGLQAGQHLAMPDTPRRGDVFHALQEVEALVTYLDNRAYDAIAARSKLDQRQARSVRRRGRGHATVAQKLRHARAAENQAVALAADVARLYTTDCACSG